MGIPVRNTLVMSPDLVVRAKSDRTVLTEIIHFLQPELISKVRASRIHPNDYPDAVQEVLILVIGCVKSFDPSKGDFLHYVRVSVSGLLKDFHSKEGRRHAGVVSGQVDVPAPVQKELPSAEEYMRDLTEVQRNVVGDHFGLGGSRPYSINQIAARRGMPNAKVKKELAEALVAMRGAQV